MQLLFSALFASAAGLSHDMITKEEWDTESRGKKIFIDLYTDW